VDPQDEPPAVMECPSVSEREPVAPWRVIAWLSFTLGLGAINAYANYALDSETPDDLAYRYSTAVAALVQYGIFLAIVAGIAWGLPRRETFALRQPPSWPRALLLATGSLAAIYVLASVYLAALSTVTDKTPTDEQGLLPEGWDSSRAGAFAAYFVAVAVLGPVVEELLFRGLGYRLFEPYGQWTAIVATSVVFGLYHGLVLALPLLTLVGLALAVVRARTSSLYPAIVLHSVFNGLALIVSVV
jgi:hypothetical protein